MGQVLILVLFFAFLIRTIRNALYQVFLWQLKEYRLDRMLVHLKTWQGKRLIFGPMSAVKWSLIGSHLLGLPIFWPTFGVYLMEAMLNLREMRFSFRKPVFTLKASFVVSLAIVGEIGGFWVFGNWANLSNLALTVLILDKGLAPTVALLFLGLSIPTNIQKESVIGRAREIVKKHPGLVTIGITGSYGKTSTKEFLATILEKKFKVLKTVGSNNTDIGVAKTVVENLKDQQVFVCEMAAYKKGEIKAICDIVRPKIGIITGINEQHLDLFGSLEDTMKAKFELIEALPEDGLAVFNGNNLYCQQLAVKSRERGLKTVLYKCFKTFIQSGGANVWATDIMIEPKQLNFTVCLNNREKRQVWTNLLGQQNIENILAGVATAHHLGMTLREIADAVENLTPPEMTMKPYRGPFGSTLIDDTFNANPAGVLAAVDYMRVYKGKKILVLQPMIELGQEANRLHQELGEMAARVCDQVYLTNKNFYEPILEGAALVKNGREKIFLLAGKRMVKKIGQDLTSADVVVFEGKEARKALSGLRSLANL